jgi:hypothetical protein
MDIHSDKQCQKCGIRKPLESFTPRRDSKDGRTGTCKTCQNEAYRRRYRENPTPILTRHQKMRQDAPEATREVAKRRYRNHRDEMLTKGKRWNFANPEKYRAHKKLNNAILLGHMTRPTVCERCGKTGRVDGHHHDYSKPFDVEWLCRSCHVQQTLREKEQKQAEGALSR